jgi:hypothetical protein
MNDETNATPATPARAHKIRVLNKRGDTAVLWTEDAPADIATAADEFLRLRQSGATMYAMADDKTARRLDEFPPGGSLAEAEIVAIYPVTGGAR